MANVIYDETYGSWSVGMTLQRHQPSKVFVIADINAPKKILAPSHDKIIEVDYFISPTRSESEKTIEVVLDIVAEMAVAGLDRNSIVLVVGGGMTLDVGGFAASMYLRGLRTVYYPTTLLAMVDAAHGGKTGVNYKGAKNQLGAFHMPEDTIINVDLIGDMPEGLIRDGLAETVKHWYIDSSDRWLDYGVRDLYRHPKSFKADKIKKYSEFFSWLEDTEAFVAASINVKNRIVEADATEQVTGGRELLNFGHTFGHAFEVIDGLSHGAAVIVGMMAAFEIGVRENLIDSATARDHVRHLSGLLMDDEKRTYRVTSDHVDLILRDKKVKGDRISLILPKRNGRNIECVSQMVETHSIKNHLITLEVPKDD